MPRAFIRSTPLRLTVLLGAAFLASIVVTSLVAFALIRDELDRRLDRSVLDAFTVISQSYGQADVIDLTDAVTSHIGATIALDHVFLLTAPDGKVLAGNIVSAPTAPGWSTISASALGLQDRDPAYRILVGEVGGYRLVVGASFAETDAVGRVALTSIGFSSAALLIVILAVGISVAINGQRRLDGIADTMQSIGRGELARRIPVSHRRDDLDEHAIKVNVALDRLNALVEGMRQVSVDIAHDLKTPLNRLAITVENAIDLEAAGQSVRDLLYEVQSESGLINDTFDALLRIAQIESGARRSRFGPVDIVPLLGTLADAYVDVADERGQVLSLSVPPHLPPVLGDKDLLTQLFSNLIENAMRHCPSDTAISVIATLVSDTVSVTVQDTGPGIPEGERDMVFQRLYRLEKSRTTDGSGLGLSLVKAIVDLHGATITLSDANPGLRAVVILKTLAQAEPPA